MKVVVLGSGTSTGVPVIGCSCRVCRSADPKNKRLRPSLALEPPGGRWLVVDTGPDFRAQVLSHNIYPLGGVLFTHIHADHCHGFDDLRAFTFREKRPVPCYMPKEQISEFKRRFSYAFADSGYRGSVPLVDLMEIPAGEFEFLNLSVEPVRLPHGHMSTCGFRFGEFAYITDFKEFPEADLLRWQGKVKVLYASGIHFETHPSHSSIPETLDLMEKLEIDRGVIGHLSHRVDYLSDSKRLPNHVSLAYDGMVIDL